jgi:hypothetical protein
MKNITEDEIIAAYQQIVNRMPMANLGLKQHRLDNKASTAFKECIRENVMTHKLVSPGNHRRNLAERVIQMFKHHFISILSGVDNKFPLSLWCHLLRSAELTVNLLRHSNVTPKILVYAHIQGQHDYTRKPFAPLCAQYRPKSKLTFAERGTPIPKPDSTLGNPWNTIAVSRPIL